MSKITHWRYILQTLRHHRLRHLGLAISVAVCTAVITGGLLIGDSLRFTLQQQINNRIGNSSILIDCTTHPVSRELSTAINGDASITATGLSKTQAVLSFESNQGITTQAVVWGINPSFTSVKPLSVFPDQNEAILSPSLADATGLRRDDEFSLRALKPDAHSKTQLGSSRKFITLRLRVRDILPASELSFTPMQTAPQSLFVNADTAEKLSGGKIDFILVSQGTRADVASALRENFSLADAGLSLADCKQTQTEVATKILTSSDLFLPDPFLKLTKTLPNAQPVFSYFINSIEPSEQDTRSSSASTPYSFISTLNLLKSGEIALLQWVADDLHVTAGDRVRLTYYVLQKQSLIEQSRMFRIVRILPTEENADPALTLPLPGMSGANSCNDWDPDFPIDLARIRKKDEAYWNDYRGSPKAFVSFADAQDMWRNDYGGFTGIRFDIPNGSNKTLRQEITQSISPDMFGISISNIRQDLLHAVEHGVDFSGLFIGLSMFLLLSPLAMAAMLCALSVLARSDELNMLHALGIEKRIRFRLLLIEHGIVVTCGAALGALLAPAWTAAILYGLQSVWTDVTGAVSADLHLTPSTLLIGFFSSLLIGLVCIGLAFYYSTPASDQSHRQFHVEHKIHTMRLSRFRIVLYSLCALFGLSPFPVLYFFSLSAGVLFICGTLILAYVIIIFYLSCTRKRKTARKTIGFIQKTMRHRAGICTLLFAAIASGLYVVLAVSLNTPTVQNPTDYSSGTGGFAYLAKTTLPLSFNPADPLEIKKYHLPPYPWKENAIAFFTTGSGQANCLNLNRVTTPQLLGIPKDALKHRFSFSSSFKDYPANWSALEFPDTHETDQETIPAIADANVIEWGLGKKLGDTIEYTGEPGHRFSIRLVAALNASVFQGMILIDEATLLRHFPTSARRDFILAANHATDTNASSIRQNIAEALKPWGPQITDTSDYLNTFLNVEKTYLSIFLLLGTLGLLLATGTIAGICIREFSLRQNESALLHALGFSRLRRTLLLACPYLISTCSGCIWAVGCSLITAIYRLPEDFLPTSAAITTAIVLIFAIAILFTAYFFSKPSPKHTL